MLLELGKILESIRYADLPKDTTQKAKTTILNFIGTGLSGADAPAALAEKAVWESQGCAGSCVILGHRGRVSPLAAASVNALMGQVFLLEDCHENTISHPGVVAIPVALALGQSLGVGGKQVIEAITAGYECIGRIGSVLIAPGFPEFGMRPASVLAPLGAAATAAKLMGLGADGICAALSIAGNTASGVMEFVNAGTPDICLQNCFAAQNGLMAALLASRGITASPTILEGRFGLGRAFNRAELDWSRAVTSGAGHYMLDESFIKRYPGCGHVLATAQAAASMVEKHKIYPESIESVTVGVSKHASQFPGVDFQGPFLGTISAMMSHQFMAASTFVHGEVSAATVKMYDHPEVAKVAEKIFIEVDDEIDAAFPHKTGARLTVRLKSGETLQDYQEDLRPMNADEVTERFYGNAKDFFTDARAREIVDKTLNIEALESVGSLMDLLERN